MPTQIIRRHPITHSIKIAFLTISLFLIVGLLLRITSKSAPSKASQSKNEHTLQKKATEHLLHNKILIPIITLDITDTDSESNWSKQLASLLNGNTEVNVDFGRIDVLTHDFAIEVDRIPKWQEGIGQTLNYARASGKQACLALIIEPNDWPLSDLLIPKLKHIDNVCIEQRIKLVLLKNADTD